MNKRPSSEHHTPVVVPYRTRTGLEIGRLYTPPRRWGPSRDDELLQAALLGLPKNGMGTFGLLALAVAATSVVVAILVAWVLS